MSLASWGIPRKLIQNFTPVFPFALRTFSARQNSWHLTLPCQNFSSLALLTNSQMERHMRPSAQFPPVQQLSPRHPHRSALINNADRIERFFWEDGHRAWGFVIYRSTYLEWGAGLDLLDNLALTVFDDPSKFNIATTAVIRDHFKPWAATMEQEEQGPFSDPKQIRSPGSQRYRYCIQVTQRR